MQEIQKLIDICTGHHIYIQTHNFPDPDAIASSYGLQMFLKHYGISSTLCYEGKIDKLSTKKMTSIFQLDIHAYDDLKNTMQPEDYIICVDSQKEGGNITDFVGEEIAAIDHHPTYKEVAYRYKDIRITGSCASIITDYFRQMDVPMDAMTATALLYGLKMDTNQMSRGVKKLDIDAFGYLYPLMDPEVMNRLESNNMEFRDLKAYGAVIENIRVYGDMGFACIPFSCPDALIAIVSDFILQLDVVHVTVIYSIREDGYKFSVRSETADVSAGRVANEALKDLGNGGGHDTMAGGMIRKEQIGKLGAYPEDRLLEIFTDVVQKQRGKQLS